MQGQTHLESYPSQSIGLRGQPSLRPYGRSALEDNLVGKPIQDGREALPPADMPLLSSLGFERVDNRHQSIESQSRSPSRPSSSGVIHPRLSASINPSNSLTNRPTAGATRESSSYLRHQRDPRDTRDTRDPRDQRDPRHSRDPHRLARKGRSGSRASKSRTKVRETPSQDHGNSQQPSKVLMFDQPQLYAQAHRESLHNTIDETKAKRLANLMSRFQYAGVTPYGQPNPNPATVATANAGQAIPAIPTSPVPQKGPTAINYHTQAIRPTHGSIESHASQVRNQLDLRNKMLETLLYGDLNNPETAGISRGQLGYNPLMTIRNREKREAAFNNNHISPHLSAHSHDEILGKSRSSDSSDSGSESATNMFPSKSSSMWEVTVPELFQDLTYRYNMLRSNRHKSSNSEGQMVSSSSESTASSAASSTSDGTAGKLSSYSNGHSAPEHNGYGGSADTSLDAVSGLAYHHLGSTAGAPHNIGASNTLSVTPALTRNKNSQSCTSMYTLNQSSTNSSAPLRLIDRLRNAHSDDNEIPFDCVASPPDSKTDLHVQSRPVFCRNRQSFSRQSGGAISGGRHNSTHSFSSSASNGKQGSFNDSQDGISSRKSSTSLKRLAALDTGRSQQHQIPSLIVSTYDSDQESKFMKSGTPEYHWKKSGWDTMYSPSTTSLDAANQHMMGHRKRSSVPQDPLIHYNVDSTDTVNSPPFNGDVGTSGLRPSALPHPESVAEQADAEAETELEYMIALFRIALFKQDMELSHSASCLEINPGCQELVKQSTSPLFCDALRLRIKNESVPHYLKHLAKVEKNVLDQQKSLEMSLAGPLDALRVTTDRMVSEVNTTLNRQLREASARYDRLNSCKDSKCLVRLGYTVLEWVVLLTMWMCWAFVSGTRTICRTAHWLVI